MTPPTWHHPPALTGTELSIGTANGTLWALDSGGSGTPVVFMHPASVGGNAWGFQQAALTAAGYRTICYSRPGYPGSGPIDADATATLAYELASVADALDLPRFHLVGVAAGGIGVTEAAIAMPDRLRSITIANSLVGISDEHFAARIKRLMQPLFALPESVRELGPHFRAFHPEGVEAWEALHRDAQSGMAGRVTLRTNPVSWAAFESIALPALLVTGDADLFMPPSWLREIAVHLPQAEVAIIADCGHAAYWEQPERFNDLLLAFMNRH